MTASRAFKESVEIRGLMFRELRSVGANYVEIADSFGVSRFTVYRLRDLLRRMSSPRTNGARDALCFWCGEDAWCYLAEGKPRCAKCRRAHNLARMGAA